MTWEGKPIKLFLISFTAKTCENPNVLYICPHGHWPGFSIKLSCFNDIYEADGVSQLRITQPLKYVYCTILGLNENFMQMHLRSGHLKKNVH